MACVLGILIGLQVLCRSQELLLGPSLPTSSYESSVYENVRLVGLSGVVLKQFDEILDHDDARGRRFDISQLILRPTNQDLLGAGNAVEIAPDRQARIFNDGLAVDDRPGFGNSDAFDNRVR